MRRLDLMFIAAAITLGVLMLLDTITTVIGLSLGASETNPTGLYIPQVAKAIVIICIVLVYVKGGTRPRRLFSLIMAVVFAVCFLLAVINNLTVIRNLS